MRVRPGELTCLFCTIRKWRFKYKVSDLFGQLNSQGQMNRTTQKKGGLAGHLFIQNK